MMEQFEMESNFLNDTTTMAIKLFRHGDLERMERAEMKIKSFDDTEMNIDPVVFTGEEDLKD